MADEQQNPDEVKVEPDDPEYTLEEHIAYKRKQEAISVQLRKLIQDGLGDFKLIMDGTAFAFTKLTLPNKGIVSVSEIITEYPHLRQLDLSTNCISDIIQIQKLRFVTHLNLSRNCIAESRFLSNPALFPFLKSLNISNNKLKVLPSIQLLRVTHINLNSNQITSLEQFNGHPVLETLQLRGNKISSLKDISKCPNLKNIYLADNSISCLQGMGNLPSLNRLHLRKNKISDLGQFAELPALQYLNIRQNQVSKLDAIKKVTLAVKVINLIGNPVSEELGDNTKKQVWMKFRQYQKINKSDMTAEEKDQFDKEYKERIAEQERQAKERAEREAAEAAEAAQKAEQ